MPPTFETIMEDLDVNVGETPRFAVVVEGKPIPDILWYKVCFICSCVNDTLSFHIILEHLCLESFSQSFHILHM